MKFFLISAALTILACPAAGAVTDGRAKTVRDVQIISMAAHAADAIRSQGEAPDQRTVAVEAPLLASEFRVHELGRRWVAFQMASAFVNYIASPEPAVGETAPINAKISSFDAGARLPPASAISVPLWMLGGNAFAPASARYGSNCAARPYRPAGFLKAATEMRRAGYYQLMSEIACEHGIPVDLFDAMIIRESSYRADAVSSRNAFGLTQLMPGTAAAMGINRYSLEDNLRGGARYLRQQLDSFGHYHLALAAYNAGPGRIRGGLVPQISETRAYVDNVLSNWSRLAGAYRQATILQRHDPDTPEPVIKRRGRDARVSLF